jgi:hypothetical protein
MIIGTNQSPLLYWSIPTITRLAKISQMPANIQPHDTRQALDDARHKSISASEDVGWFFVGKNKKTPKTPHRYTHACDMMKLCYPITLNPAY